MKILKQGTPPPAKWWIGLKLTCDCGAEVELEEGDRLTTGWGFNAVPSTEQHYVVLCPCCKRSIKFPYWANPVPQWPQRPPYTLGDFDRDYQCR